MLETGVFSRLSASSFQGSSLVRKKNASEYVIQIGGVNSKKDRNHPLSHYLQLRMFHVPSAKWLPNSIVSNGYFNRAYHAAVAIGDDIFVFGGENTGSRNMYPPLLNFQQAEPDVLKISKGFFGYKTSVASLETELDANCLGLIGHSASVLSYEGKEYVIIYGGFEPSISGKYKFNSRIFIFSIEDAAEYNAAKNAAAATAGGGAHTDQTSNTNGGSKIYLLRVVEADPTQASPPSRAFHAAVVIPTSAKSGDNSSTSSCQVLIYGGQGDNAGVVYDDCWQLDLSEYLKFLQVETFERKKAASQPVVAAAPAGKDAKKDNKKDAVGAVPAKPSYPFAQWRAISRIDARSSADDETFSEENASAEIVSQKRWDHTLSIWPIEQVEGTLHYHMLITGGHASPNSTEQIIDSFDQQLHFSLSISTQNQSTLKRVEQSKGDSMYRLSSQELPALWGSRSETIIPSDVLSRGAGEDNSDHSLSEDDEGVAILVFGGFHVDQHKTAWPSRPGSPVNINPSGMNHHLLDLSATIAASRTVTTIVSPDLLTTSALFQQNPRKMQLRVAEQDFLDCTYVLISSDEKTDDPSLSVVTVKRLKQRNLAREYLRRVMNEEDPSRVKADILDKLRRANMEMAAVTFEHRRIVYPQTGNVYEGQVVPVSSLINVAKEAGEAEPSCDNEFEGVVPHGNGCMTFASTGNVYEGNWQNGRAHGNGIFTDAANDTRYEGQFVENIQQGQGKTIDLNNGDSPRWEHEGEYQNNSFDGPGEFTDVGQGLVFIGNFKKGLKDGPGKIVLSSDRKKFICESSWSNDVMVGEGIAYSLPIISLNIIKGHLPTTIVLNTSFDLSIASSLRPPPWLAVKEDRKTLLIAGDYSGKLLDGKPNDEQGTAVYSDASVCKAAWKMGRRNGPGVYVFGPDRTQYEGKWVGDRRVGYGTWRLPTNQIIYDGLWSENVFHGTGRLLDYDVDVVYEGEFRYGFKEGQGLIRPRCSNEEELQRIVEGKTKTLAKAPASPGDLLDQSQWIRDHTVLFPSEPPKRNLLQNDGNSIANESYLSASYPPSPSESASPHVRSAFNSPTASRSGRR